MNTSAAEASGKRLTVNDIRAYRTAGQKFPVLTAYDATTAGLFDAAGIPALLVGDSAAMVVYGYDSTIPVTVDEMLPLVRAVVRGSRRAFIIADLPFGSYQESAEQALATSMRFIKEGNANAVKLEGGLHMVPQVEALVAAGIPVVGHLGLTPQSVNQFGGYRVQGRGDAGDPLIAAARALEAAGAFALVLEVVPAELAARLHAAVSIPVIGIGAGSQVDGQVLVWQDLLGFNSHHKPKFVVEYANLYGIATDAVRQWADDVRSGNYPDAEHEYH